MNKNTESYQIVDLTPQRRAWLNTFDLPRPKHQMYGLLEVDVTTVRQFIAEHKARTGEALSLTGYLALCVARALADDRTVQAYRKGRRQLVLFENVDVGLMIERQEGEKRVLTGHVIKEADRKSYLEINREIRSVQTAPVSPMSQSAVRFYSAMQLPWPLSRFFISLFSMVVRRNPTIPVSMMGTVGITAVGMFGKDHSGWGLYPTRHSLDLVVGSIAWKPVVVEGRIEPREILHLTVAFDHDVIDGAPAARFVRSLVELIEGGCGLCEQVTLNETAR